MSSLFPSLANRRPSIDSALLAEKKAGKYEDEDRKSSVPTLSSDKTDCDNDDDDQLKAIRRPRSNTFSGQNHLDVDNISIGNSLGGTKQDKSLSGINNEPYLDNSVDSTNCDVQGPKVPSQPRGHEPIIFKVNPNELTNGQDVHNRGSQLATNSLDLAITSANTKNTGILPGQKITVHLNTSTTSNSRDSSDSVPAIVLNDDEPLTPEVFVTPGSPRKLSTDNYFFTRETTVDSSTFVFDSWTDSTGRTEQLSKPDSKVCIQTVDQKGQTITVKLDGFSSVELPVNKSTSTYVRRASTGSEGIEFFSKTIQ